MTGDANSFDVAIVGGGVNGLLAAAMLAKAGRKVVLCEALERFGGATGLSTLAPGVRAPKCSHLVSGLPPALIRKLKLKKHGLHVVQEKVGRLALDPDGRHIPFGSGRRLTREAIFQWSRHDADAWDAFNKRLDALTQAMLPMATGASPALMPQTRQEKLVWIRHFARVRRKGRMVFQDVLKTLPSNAADFLEDAFETGLLKGALSFEAVLGGRHGPRAPGTMFSWAWQRALEASTRKGTIQLAGGPDALADALAIAARTYGAELRASAQVASINIADGCVTGFVLKNGDEISAPVVVSAIGPKATYLGLVGARHLDAGLARDISQIRMRGASAKVNLALGKLPAFANATPDDLSARLIVAPSLEGVERAADAAKYGELPAQAVMEVTLPSIRDESLAPEGRHVLSAIVPFVPFDRKGGRADGADRLMADVIKTLGTYAPDLPDLVMAGEVLTPLDIESQCGLAGADWHQGELTMDQALMMRPVPQLADFAGPVSGLYLGGAGAHPGGGLHGRPAMAAVSAILGNGRRSR